MYSESRKLHLLEDLIKLTDKAALLEIEILVKRAIHGQDTSRPSAHSFVGLWSRRDAEAIEKAIEEGCE